METTLSLSRLGIENHPLNRLRELLRKNTSHEESVAISFDEEKEVNAQT